MVDQTRINNGKIETPNGEIDLATLLTAEVSELAGPITEKSITQIDGGGLEHDGNGRLQVNSSYFDGSINGISNPLSADIDATGYNINNAGSVDANSVNTDALENGVAGDNNTIKDVGGDTGERVLVGNIPFLPAESVSVTSTTFSQLGGPNDFVNVGLVGATTNMGPIEARIVGRVFTLDQDLTLRLRSDAGTETTITTTGSFVGDWNETSVTAIMLQGKLANQTSGDQADIHRISVEFSRVIGE